MAAQASDWTTEPTIGSIGRRFGRCAWSSSTPGRGRSVTTGTCAPVSREHRDGRAIAVRGRCRMNNEILDALSQITREKSVDRALLIETLEQGLASAVRKKYGATADVEARFAGETGAISIVLKKTVADPVEDPALQMTLQEARLVRPG